MQAGRSVLFIPAYRLVQDMLAAKRDLDLPRMLRKLDNFDLLVKSASGSVAANTARASCYHNCHYEYDFFRIHQSLIRYKVATSSRNYHTTLTKQQILSRWMRWILSCFSYEDADPSKESLLFANP